MRLRHFRAARQNRCRRIEFQELGDELLAFGMRETLHGALHPRNERRARH